MTTFNRSDCNKNIYLLINDLTPAKHDQCIPAKSGQGHRHFY